MWEINEAFSAVVLANIKVLTCLQSNTVYYTEDILHYIIFQISFHLTNVFISVR